MTTTTTQPAQEEVIISPSGTHPNRLRIVSGAGWELELQSEFETLSELISKARKIKAQLLNSPAKSKPTYIQ